jgi:L-alanine-DL-glutamate epimerase-like enolase superfamily enzyme
VTDPIGSIHVATCRLALPVPLRLGPVQIASREYAAVRVTTESGLVGSAYCLTREAPVEECVTRLITPALLGVDSTEPERAWHRAFRATVLIGRVGLVVRALGLVDIALWDIAAQRAGRPLWQLLAGAPDPVRALIVAAYPLPDRTPESLADDVLRHAGDGYRLLKVARDPDPGRMRRLLDRAAAELPDEARVVVDAGFGWEKSAAVLEETEGWGEQRLAWLEDPLVPEDVEGYAELARRPPSGRSSRPRGSTCFASTSSQWVESRRLAASSTSHYRTASSSRFTSIPRPASISPWPREGSSRRSSVAYPAATRSTLPTV